MASTPFSSPSSSVQAPASATPSPTVTARVVTPLRSSKSSLVAAPVERQLRLRKLHVHQACLRLLLPPSLNSPRNPRLLDAATAMSSISDVVSHSCAATTSKLSSPGVAAVVPTYCFAVFFDHCSEASPWSASFFEFFDSSSSILLFLPERTSSLPKLYSKNSRTAPFPVLTGSQYDDVELTTMARILRRNPQA